MSEENGAKERVERGITKGCKELFGWYVHYLDSSDSFTSIYIKAKKPECQNNRNNGSLWRALQPRSAPLSEWGQGQPANCLWPLPQPATPSIKVGMAGSAPISPNRTQPMHKFMQQVSSMYIIHQLVCFKHGQFIIDQVFNCLFLTLCFVLTKF